HFLFPKWSDSRREGSLTSQPSASLVSLPCIERKRIGFFLFSLFSSLSSSSFISSSFPFLFFSSSNFSCSHLKKSTTILLLQSSLSSSISLLIPSPSSFLSSL
ncbi:hypothetical protein PFISCL1PPCAC_15240, partial [Pristionchus fissidentatus]